MSCELKDWISMKNNSQYCKIHIVSFPITERCPFRSTPPFFADGDLDKELGILDDNSRVITSKSRGVSITREPVSKRNYKRKDKSIYERFHNYGVKFEAIVDWDSIEAPLKRLNNNVFWKRLDYDNAIVKVFRKSILVTLRKDREIIHNKVKDAELKSISLINDVLDQLPLSIVVSNRDVVNTHNAFVNHPFAKRDVKVSVNDELRFISDNSKGSPEFEAVNPKFAVSDSEYIENDTISLIDKGLSRDFLAAAINKLVEDRNYYADNLKSHVSAINTLGSSVSELKEVVSKFSTNSPLLSQVKDVSSLPVVSRSCEGCPSEDLLHLTSSYSCPPITLSKFDIENKSKAYRLFRARKLLEEFGWGESKW